jgi:hypothetical protein
MKTVFVSHASQDKPFVYRLVFELLSEGVPVWLDKWEFGPGDSLIMNLDSGLDGSACVLVIESSHATKTKWVNYEVELTIKAEQRLDRRLLVPVRIDASDGLPLLKDRVHITVTDGPDFMEGVHALIDHLRGMGLSKKLSGRSILPLLFHRGIELDTFILDRIFTRWIYSGFKRADIMASTMQLVKNEDYIELQRALRARISNYMSTEGSTAEGLSDMRQIDHDIVRRERYLCERSALILREFGKGFGLSNGHLIAVVRWFTRVAMHYLTITLEATRSPHVTSISTFSNALKTLPDYHTDPEGSVWWKISEPISCPIHHFDRQGRHHMTTKVIVPRSSLQVSEKGMDDYLGIPLPGTFEFETLTNIVLPQLVYKCPFDSDSEIGPAAWDENNFRVWRK